jgi:methylated-DNA-protein-cysteine methyltransferase-like protein
MKKSLSSSRSPAKNVRTKSRERKRGIARPDSSRERIYAEVRKVPRGKVATYGQIAMAAVPSSSAIPWHRVINAEGRVSMRSEGPGGTIIQQQLLEREGVAFDAGGRVSLARFGWKPRR